MGEGDKASDEGDGLSILKKKDALLLTSRLTKFVDASGKNADKFVWRCTTGSQEIKELKKEDNTVILETKKELREMKLPGVLTNVSAKYEIVAKVHARQARESLKTGELQPHLLEFEVHPLAYHDPWNNSRFLWECTNVSCNEGKPDENANTPKLRVHIQLLRGALKVSWLVDTWIVVVKKDGSLDITSPGDDDVVDIMSRLGDALRGNRPQQVYEIIHDHGSVPTQLFKTLKDRALCTLTTLNLSGLGERFKDALGKVLAKSLKDNAVLQSLELRSCDLTSTGVMPILDVISQKKSDNTLATMDVRDNRLSEDIAFRTIHMLTTAKECNLRCVYLHGNDEISSPLVLAAMTVGRGGYLDVTTAILGYSDEPIARVPVCILGDTQADTDLVSNWLLGEDSPPSDGDEPIWRGHGYTDLRIDRNSLDLILVPSTSTASAEVTVDDVPIVSTGRPSDANANQTGGAVLKRVFDHGQSFWQPRRGVAKHGSETHLQDVLNSAMYFWEQGWNGEPITVSPDACDSIAQELSASLTPTTDGKAKGSKVPQYTVALDTGSSDAVLANTAAWSKSQSSEVVQSETTPPAVAALDFYRIASPNAPLAHLPPVTARANIIVLNPLTSTDVVARARAWTQLVVAQNKDADSNPLDHVRFLVLSLAGDDDLLHQIAEAVSLPLNRVIPCPLADETEGDAFGDHPNARSGTSALIALAMDRAHRPRLLLERVILHEIDRQRCTHKSPITCSCELANETVTRYRGTASDEGLRAITTASMNRGDSCMIPVFMQSDCAAPDGQDGCPTQIVSQAGYLLGSVLPALTSFPPREIYESLQPPVRAKWNQVRDKGLVDPFLIHAVLQDMQSSYHYAHIIHDLSSLLIGTCVTMKGDLSGEVKEGAVCVAPFDASDNGIQHDTLFLIPGLVIFQDTTASIPESVLDVSQLASVQRVAIQGVDNDIQGPWSFVFPSTIVALFMSPPLSYSITHALLYNRVVFITLGKGEESKGNTASLAMVLESTGTVAIGLVSDGGQQITGHEGLVIAVCDKCRDMLSHGFPGLTIETEAISSNVIKTE